MHANRWLIFSKMITGMHRFFCENQHKYLLNKKTE